jgi:hypothetical protein
MRENHARRVEAALHRAAQKLVHVGGDVHKEAPAAASKPTAEPMPVVLTSEQKDLRWSLPNRGVSAAAAAEAQSAHSSFEDRFSASRDTNSVQKPSVIQRMMDPVGVIPDIP